MPLNIFTITDNPYFIQYITGEDNYLDAKNNNGDVAILSADYGEADFTIT